MRQREILSSTTPPSGSCAMPTLLKASTLKKMYLYRKSTSMEVKYPLNSYHLHRKTPHAAILPSLLVACTAQFVPSLSTTGKTRTMTCVSTSISQKTSTTIPSCWTPSSAFVQVGMKWLARESWSQFMLNAYP